MSLFYWYRLERDCMREFEFLLVLGKIEFNYCYIDWIIKCFLFMIVN